MSSSHSVSSQWILHYYLHLVDGVQEGSSNRGCPVHNLTSYQVVSWSVREVHKSCPSGEAQLQGVINIQETKGFIPTSWKCITRGNLKYGACEETVLTRQWHSPFMSSTGSQYSAHRLEVCCPSSSPSLATLTSPEQSEFIGTLSIA